MYCRCIYATALPMWLVGDPVFGCKWHCNCYCDTVCCHQWDIMSPACAITSINFIMPCRFILMHCLWLQSATNQQQGFYNCSKQVVLARSHRSQQLQPVSWFYVQGASSTCLSQRTSRAWLMWLPVFITPLVLFEQSSTASVSVPVWLMHCWIHWINHSHCSACWTVHSEWICCLIVQLLDCLWMILRTSGWMMLGGFLLRFCCQQ